MQVLFKKEDPMLTLESADRVLFDGWCRTGVLRSIRPDLIRKQNATILFGCSDGHVFGDFYDHYRKVVSDCTCHQPCPFLGGVLRLVYGTLQDRELILSEIRTAALAKKATKIAVTGHYPCLWGKQQGIPALQLPEATLLAAEYIQRDHEHHREHFTNAGLELPLIVPKIHVAYSRTELKTWYLSRNAWKAYALPQVARSVHAA